MKTAVAALLAFLAIGAILIYHSPNTPESESHSQLPVLGVAQDFELIDSKEQPFRFLDLEQNVRVVNFFFANCPSICPAIHARMREIHNQFADDSSIQFVSISVDPSRDTPEELEEYARKFRKNENTWHFLTGEQEQISKIMEEIFLLGSGELPDEHTTRLVLVDRDNQIRGYYQGLEDHSVKELGLHIARIRRRS